MKHLFLLAFQLSAFFLYAQGPIEGKINDEKGSPLIGANLLIKDTDKGTTTDAQGNFYLDAGISFPFTLQISFIGFQTKTIVVENDDFLSISLSKSVEVEEVTIDARISTTELSMVSPLQVQKISSQELQKAACCNLSESFETNATVDVTFSDAVSGAKQIKMLGLDGVYTQITQENLPLIRGLSSSYGLAYVPGTWIESIQVIKGAGSVINGFESFTGKINLEYFKPEDSDKLYWNFYANSERKFENNLQYAKKTGKWQSNLFTSINYHDQEIDQDKNGFLDMPHIKYFNLLNRWIREDERYHFNFIARFLTENREGGQLDEVINPYKIVIDNTIMEFSAKTGFKMPNSPDKSFGIQTAFRRHQQDIAFGPTDYQGLQESAYLNLIRQTYLRHNYHALTYGMSYYADRYAESYQGQNFDRTDLTTGLFSEYSYTSDNQTVLIAGFRADYHNEHGLNYTPRVNLKMNPTEQTVFRLSAGRAMRIANPIAENTNYFASSRTFEIEDDLEMELALNYGINVTHCFKLFDREATFNADAYRTQFDNQVVVDVEDPSKLRFYNLEGESYANSFQFDLNYELFQRFDVKLAYKINQVYTTFDGVKKLSPLVPKDRALINLAYATNHQHKWMFDLSWNYIGESRIPQHQSVDKEMSDSFFLMNSQLTKKFNDFDVYLGGENLFSFKQENPILGANDPYGEDFDASLIWAPIMGRLIYTGIRLKIN